MKRRLQRRRVLTLGLVVIAGVALLSGAPHAVRAGQQPYIFTTIDFPGASVTQLYGINPGGDVVGTYQNAAPANKNHGFVLKAGNFTSLDYPGSDVDYSIATAIGPAGDIVGYYGLQSGPPTNGHGFVLTKQGEWTDIGNPGGLTPVPEMTPGPFRILPDGTLIGCFHYATPTGAYISMHGFTLEPDGTFTRFDYPATRMSFAMHYGATPNGKTIVGQYMEGGRSYGYILSRDDADVVTFEVPGSVYTVPTDINAAGIIVGMYRKPGEAANIRHGFVLDRRHSANQADWQYTLVDVPGATITRMRGMNAGGDIVGDYVDEDGKNHGFVASRAGK